LPCCLSAQVHAQGDRMCWRKIARIVHPPSSNFLYHWTTLLGYLLCRRFLQPWRLNLSGRISFYNTSSPSGMTFGLQGRPLGAKLSPKGKHSRLGERLSPRGNTHPFIHPHVASTPSLYIEERSGKYVEGRHSLGPTFVPRDQLHP
jgi:hypothetical protein